MVLYYYIVKSRKHYLDKFTPPIEPYGIISSNYSPRPSSLRPLNLLSRRLVVSKLPTVAFFPVTKRALGSHVAPRAFLFAGTRATIRFDVLGPIAILARLARFLPQLHVAMAHEPLLNLPAGAYEDEYHYEPAHAYHLTLCTRSHHTLNPKSSVSRISVLPSVESGLLGRSSLLSA